MVTDRPYEKRHDWKMEMPNVEGGIENLLRCIPKRQLHRLGNTRYLIHSSYGAGQLVQTNINTNNFPKLREGGRS